MLPQPAGERDSAMNAKVIEVLRWINEVRSIRGVEPLADMPRGVPCDPHACPVARALDADVMFDGVVLAHGAGWSPVHLPAAAQTFANDFDIGLYPALEEVGSGSDPSSQRTSELVSA